MHTRTLAYGLMAMGAFVALTASAAPAADAEKESDFKFRFVGPKVGNRIASVAAVAGDPSVHYAGAASGGVWKSTDGGNRWVPVFDKQTPAAIGALAVAPSQPGTVWAGSGEARIIVNPADPDIVFACVLGRATGRGGRAAAGRGAARAVISP